MRSIMVMFASIALMGTSSAFAAQGSQCGKRDDVVKLLDSKYREQLSGFGLAGQSSIVEVYISKSGSFTILPTMTNGLTCIIAAGQSWEKVKPQEKMSAI